MDAATRIIELAKQVEKTKKIADRQEALLEIERLARDTRWEIDHKRSSVRVTVKEAADRMDATEAFVRSGLRQGKFGFGTSCTITGDTDMAYIKRDLFEKFMAGNLPFNLQA